MENNESEKRVFMGPPLEILNRFFSSLYERKTAELVEVVKFKSFEGTLCFLKLTSIILP